MRPIPASNDASRGICDENRPAPRQRSSSSATAGPPRSSGARLPHSAQRLQSCIAPAFGVRGGRESCGEGTSIGLEARPLTPSPINRGTPRRLGPNFHQRRKALPLPPLPLALPALIPGPDILLHPIGKMKGRRQVDPHVALVQLHHASAQRLGVLHVGKRFVLIARGKQAILVEIFSQYCSYGESYFDERGDHLYCASPGRGANARI